MFTSSACHDLSDGCWKDPTYDALFDKQHTTLDPQARLPIVQQMQQYVYDQIPNIVVAYPNALEAYRTDRVAGLTPTPAKDGYLMPSYVYTSMVTAHPAGTGSTSSPSSPGLPAWAWVAIVVVIVGGGFALFRRGGRRDDDAETD